MFRNEARDPDHTVPRATYIAVLGIGTLCTLSSWLVISELHPPADSPKLTGPLRGFHRGLTRGPLSVLDGPGGRKVMHRHQCRVEGWAQGHRTRGTRRRASQRGHPWQKYPGGTER